MVKRMPKYGWRRKDKRRVFIEALRRVYAENEPLGGRSEEMERFVNGLNRYPLSARCGGVAVDAL